jgi:hypothetical protein
MKVWSILEHFGASAPAAGAVWAVFLIRSSQHLQSLHDAPEQHSILKKCCMGLQSVASTCDLHSTPKPLSDFDELCRVAVRRLPGRETRGMDRIRFIVAPWRAACPLWERDKGVSLSFGAQLREFSKIRAIA